MKRKPFCLFEAENFEGVNISTARWQMKVKF
jgi:hypothetical protein